MKWYDNLFLGKKAAKKAARMKWKINHNAGMISAYVITVASHPDNLKDIIPSRELLQKGYPKKDMIIIGLADGYEEALEVVQQIVQETYDQTGGMDVKSYLFAGRDSS